MTKSSKDLWIEKQTAEIARLKERVAELEAANRRDSLLGHAEMEENNNLIVDLRKKVESLEARAVRWEGKGVAPNDGETIVALCDVGGRRVFRPIIYVAGYGWKKTAFHYAIKRWCSHEALAKSAGVDGE